MSFEHRDKSGPMDIDQTHPLGRLAEYIDGGHARKRLHSDAHGAIPDPFSTPTPASNYRFGPNTPFLFHAPPLPPASKFAPYDPNRWAATDFGFGPDAAGAAAAAAGLPPGADDIDMSLHMESPMHTPARPAPKATTGTTANAATVEDAPDGGHEPGPDAKHDAGSDGRKIAGGAVARVRRRRQKEWGGRRRRADSESEGEGEGEGEHRGAVSRRRGGGGRQEHHYNLHMAQPGVRHSEFVFNASLVVGFLYIATQFVVAVRRDVQDRIEEYSVEILQEIASCTQAYMTNRCEPSLRVPAMEAPCGAWETCMNRDPTVVGRARVGAETFAGVINSFVDPISWKTMGFTVVTLTFLIILTNSALLNLRAKHQAQHAAAHAAVPPPPPGYAPHLGMPGMPGMGMGMGMQGMYGQYGGMPAASGGAPAIGGGGAGADAGAGERKALGWLGKRGW